MIIKHFAYRAYEKSTKTMRSSIDLLEIEIEYIWSNDVMYGGFGGSVVKATSSHHWGYGFESVSSLWSHVEGVRQHSAESRGFSPGSPVSSQGKTWQGGLRQIV